MKPKLKILGGVIPIVFLLDQGTKQLIVHLIPLHDSYAVIPGLFDIVHTRNRGAAFGFLARMPDSFRLPFFLVVSFIALTLITIYFFRLQDSRKGTFVCLALILGGAFGNIWDRITLGEVVDFLSFHWYDETVRWSLGRLWVHFKLEWPAFNIADMAISISVIWLSLSHLFQRKPEEPAA